jgi:hypothetical protein
VPRRIADDEDVPRRRRRGAATVAAEPEAERGLVLRILLHSPKDTVASLLAFAAISAIVANALFLQAGPHPSPMFGSIVTMPVPAQAPVNPLPRPRPAEASRSELSPPEPKAEPRVIEMKPAEPRAADVKSADPLTNLVKATSTAPVATASIPRPPAPIPVSSRGDSMLSPGGSRRVAAVQRALTAYGYGQLKPTGTIGSDTQAAITKFERERNIPANGQMNERLVHELSVMIGHPID